MKISFVATKLLFGTLFAAVAPAATLYSYVGPNFTLIQGNPGFTTSDNISVNLLYSAALPPSEAISNCCTPYDVQIIPDAWSVSVGGLTFTNDNWSADNITEFDLTTDANGNIANWFVELAGSGYLRIVTCDNQTGCVGDSVQYYPGGGVNIASDDPRTQGVGLWTSSEVSVAPEPGSVGLLAIGIVACAFSRRQSITARWLNR